MKTPTLVLLFLMALPGIARSQDCEVRVLVSDFSGNDVRVLNGCTGQFLQNLDRNGRLSGPQALRLGSDQRIYVVSEQNNRVARYDAETLEFVDLFLDGDLGGVTQPTGMAFGPDGDLYVAGFTSDNVGRYDGQTGAFKGIFASAPGELSGPDAGMIFGPDGNLFVPSFNNDRVLRFDGSTGALIDTVIPEGFGGLQAPRTVFFTPDGERMLVTSWRNSRVLEFTPEGAFVAQLATVLRPTGIDFGNNGDLLIATDQNGQVASIDPVSGAVNPPFVATGGSFIQAGTFILTLGATTPQAEQTHNEQFWIVGAGPIDGTRLIIEEAVSTTDGRFGDALDPATIQRPTWGRIEIEFTACDQAELSWVSETAEFPDGGYPLIRLAPTPAQSACEDEGFGATSTMDWIVGAWFGGEERSGEGLLIDVLDGGLAFAAWFTYTP